MKTKVIVLATMALMLLSSGCAMLPRKKEVMKVHKGHLCTINATIIKVKDVREDVQFKGLLAKPEKKKFCNIVIKTDQNEVMTVNNDMVFTTNDASSTVKDGYIECSDASINRRVAVTTDEEGRLVGVDPNPNPYLEEKNPKR